MKGLKYDNNKIRFSLLPLESLKAIVEVLEFGAKKYTINSWQGIETERYYDALLRHLFAWKQGEKDDPESKLNHLAHVATNALFILWFEIKKKIK